MTIWKFTQRRAFMLFQMCKNPFFFLVALYIAKGPLLISFTTGGEIVIIYGKSLWNALFLESFRYKRVVPSLQKWASWNSWVKFSVGEVEICHRWILPLSKATSAICRAEPVPCCGRFCLFLCKHRAGPGLPHGGLPGWNLGRLWSRLRLADPAQKGRQLDL